MQVKENNQNRTQWSKCKRKKRNQDNQHSFRRNEKIHHWSEMVLVMNIIVQVTTTIVIYGITDDAKADENDQFFETKNETIIVGELNCIVAKEEKVDVIDKYGEETRNFFFL